METELKAKFLKIKEIIDKPMKTESELKTCEIIVLQFHDQEVASRCASDIIKYSDYPYKLTVYNNEYNTPNMSKIWNKLIKESTCDYVLIMDSDVFVKEKWLSKMMSTFTDYPNAYLVLPSMKNTSGAQQRREQPEEGVERLKNIVAGQCMLFKKELFEKIGYFDEDFLLYGSDSEFGHRFLKSGLEGYVRKDVLVDHIGSYSINSNFESGKIDVDKQAEREYARSLYNFKTK